MVADVKKMLEIVTNALWSINTNESKFTIAASNGHYKTLPPYFSQIY